MNTCHPFVRSHRKVKMLAAAGLLGASFGACAAPVIYDFAGTGEFCTPGPTGEPICVPGQAFTGSVTIDVIAAGPGGPDGETDGRFYAWDYNGWVESHFIIEWGGRSFDFSPLPSPFFSESFAGVDNDFVPDRDSVATDALTNFTYYAVENPPEAGCGHIAYLERRTTDTSWLDDLSFDVTVGLAPGSDAVNFISFQISTLGCDAGANVGERLDALGTIVLSSFTARETIVGIDIKPREHPNTVNPRSKGVIPVAVLGSADFDSTQLNTATVAFGPGGASPLREGRIVDVNGDGFLDVVLRFKTRDVDIACGETTATLTGETFAGAPVQGTDAIRTVGCKKKPK